jgi:ketosteroid isomerase-like protein
MVMNHAIVLIFWAIVISLITPCDDGKNNYIDGASAIAKSNAIYFTAFTKGDSSIFIDRYTEDCHIMAPGLATLKGHDGAKEFFFMAYHSIGVRNGYFITQKIYCSGKDFITEEGSFSLFGEYNKPIDNGKYLVLWKHSPVGWKMFRDCFNSDSNR